MKLMNRRGVFDQTPKISIKIISTNIKKNKVITMVIKICARWLARTTLTRTTMMTRTGGPLSTSKKRDGGGSMA